MAKLTKKKALVIIKTYDRYSRPLEKRFMKRIRDYLIKQSNTIAKNLTSKYKDVKADKIGISEEDAEKESLSIIEELYTWKIADVELVKELLPLWQIAGEIGNQMANDLYYTANDKKVLYGIIREDYFTFLNKYGATQAKRINETTKENIRVILRDGLTKGVSYSDMAKEIIDKTEISSVSRATMIAETEVHNTITFANELNIKAGGFKKWQWITSADASVRPTHQAVNREIRKIGEKFSNGMLRPGDPSAPPFNLIRCRCVIIAIE